MKVAHKIQQEPAILRDFYFYQKHTQRSGEFSNELDMRLILLYKRREKSNGDAEFELLPASPPPKLPHLLVSVRPVPGP